MFVQAIEIAAQFTRPIYSIFRNYGSTQVIPGAATLFFVNAEGWALTCGHVGGNLLAAGEINSKFQSFKSEVAAQPGIKKHRHILHELEKKYGYTKKVTVELKNMFMDCIEGNLNFRIIRSAKYDIALLKFSGFTKLLCDSFPYFPKDTSGLKQGKFLCRLGFPFPEFANFAYDEASDSIMWTNSGKTTSPRFPIEGMLTRQLLDKDGQVFGFEMSTPGLRGQSGGPVLDTDGKVWGMQSATNHLDLDFDVNQEVIRNGLNKRIQDSAFLHVGHCIHVDTIKSFMREQGVTFQEK
ncbi:MAG: trypsin-like peptidase domain-containing protein [bacterium]|nr:trypsin-like peptidase domain-containing protein [bacterium]